MRAWIKKSMDHQCPPKSERTKKDKILITLGVVLDAVLIGLLVYTLMVNSCAICYSTGFGVRTFQQCKSFTDVMETGLPPEIINVYEGNAEPLNYTDGVEYGEGNLKSARIVEQIEPDR